MDGYHHHFNDFIFARGFQKTAFLFMTGLEKFRIEVKYIRRARRATLRVKPGHLIQLSLPYGIKRPQVEDWILSKTAWILEKHEVIENQNTAAIVKFADGSQVPFAGGYLTLISASAVKETVLQGSDLLVPVKFFKSEDHVKRAVIKWYQEQALQAASAAVNRYSELLKVKPKSLRLKNYRSRWGACSSKSELIFNWQIILLKKQMFEYVVAHEVCHLIEMNHSPRFYSLLSGLGFDKSDMHQQFKHLKNLI